MSTPRRRSVTPSAFQNATTASTRPAIRLGTAEKPMVTRRTSVERRAVVLEDGAQHGVVGGQAGHAHAPALEVARAPDAPAGDHRGQRALDEGAHAHEVGAALAGQGQVVDVHHRRGRRGRRRAA